MELLTETERMPEKCETAAEEGDGDSTVKSPSGEEKDSVKYLIAETKRMLEESEKLNGGGEGEVEEVGRVFPCLFSRADLVKLSELVEEHEGLVSFEDADFFVRNSGNSQSIGSGSGLELPA
jgi:hypothetical protein